MSFDYQEISESFRIKAPSTWKETNIVCYESKIKIKCYQLNVFNWNEYTDNSLLVTIFFICWKNDSIIFYIEKCFYLNILYILHALKVVVREHLFILLDVILDINSIKKEKSPPPPSILSLFWRRENKNSHPIGNYHFFKYMFKRIKFKRSSS